GNSGFAIIHAGPFEPSLTGVLEPTETSYWNTGGEGGIRTHVTVARKPHFECGAFDLSATSPQGRTGAAGAPGRLGSAAVSRTSPACQAPRTGNCGVNWGSG